MKSGMAGIIKVSPHWNQINGTDNYKRIPG